MLVGSIAKRCEQVIRQAAAKYQAETVALEIMPDHVHRLVEGEPQFGIHRLVKNLKGVFIPHAAKRISQVEIPATNALDHSYILSPLLVEHLWQS